MMPIVFRQADTADSVTVSAILAEAASWLRENGREMWRPDEVSTEAIAVNLASGDFWLLQVANAPAAAFKLQRDDPLFWPDALPGSSLLLHRIAIRRQFAGQGLLSAIFHHASQIAEQEQRHYLRLDCAADRPELRAHYLRHGFEMVDEVQAGPWHVARFQHPLLTAAITRHA